ncbi:hypothetical protein [uncultured Shewanella sp.]|uniref:hypothetical protein n=1 Tax=uncultured Shewanella sp. TaxID=173975 RepID=UPI0026150E3D|nr:hypothetical protein [uncultured Shewanella sp.]
MYAQIEKPKEHKGSVVANSVVQKRNDRKQCFGIVDNRNEPKFHTGLQLMSKEQMDMVKFYIDEGLYYTAIYHIIDKEKLGNKKYVNISTEYDDGDGGGHDVATTGWSNILEEPVVTLFQLDIDNIKATGNYEKLISTLVHEYKHVEQCLNDPRAAIEEQRHVMEFEAYFEEVKWAYSQHDKQGTYSTVDLQNAMKQMEVAYSNMDENDKGKYLDDLKRGQYYLNMMHVHHPDQQPDHFGYSESEEEKENSNYESIGEQLDDNNIKNLRLSSSEDLLNNDSDGSFGDYQ